MGMIDMSIVDGKILNYEMNYGTIQKAVNRTYENCVFYGMEGTGKTTLLDKFIEDNQYALLKKDKCLLIKIDMNVYDDAGSGQDCSSDSSDNITKSNLDLYSVINDAILDNLENLSFIEEMEAENVDDVLIQKLYNVYTKKWNDGRNLTKSTKEKLSSVLKFIKTSLKISVILIFDHADIMAKIKTIGKTHYEFLRSLIVSGSLTLWLIIDTDVKDKLQGDANGVVSMGSLIIENFNSKYTLVPFDKKETEAYLVNQQEIVDASQLEMIYDLVGGVPKLLANLASKARTIHTKEELLEVAFDKNTGCIGLLDKWGLGLFKEERKLLYRLAIEEPILYKGELDTASVELLSGLSDVSGRGLVELLKGDDEELFYQIKVPLYREYIRMMGEEYLQEDMLYGGTLEAIRKEEQEKEKQLAVLKEESSASRFGTDVPTTVIHVEAGATYIDYGDNNVIDNRTQNISQNVYIDKAIDGLEQLHRILYPSLEDKQDTTEAIQSQIQALDLNSLPYQQDSWLELDEEEQDEQMNNFADRLFQSEEFKNSELLPEQMERFHISDELLAEMNEDCRKQFISGIHIYDILDICTKQFGVTFASESPRAILFARAFENLAKDIMFSAMKANPKLNEIELNVGKRNLMIKELRNANKTTLGSYSYVLKNNTYQFFKAWSEGEIMPEKEMPWWREFTERMERITNLRNECCHSGSNFGTDSLDGLIHEIFENEAIQAIIDMKRLM